MDDIPMYLNVNPIFEYVWELTNPHPPIHHSSFFWISFTWTLRIRPRDPRVQTVSGRLNGSWLVGKWRVKRSLSPTIMWRYEQAKGHFIYNEFWRCTMSNKHGFKMLTRVWKLQNDQTCCLQKLGPCSRESAVEDFSQNDCRSVRVQLTSTA